MSLTQLAGAIALGVMLASAHAQSGAPATAPAPAAPAGAIPRPDQLEPAVTTSPVAAPAAGDAAPAVPAQSAAPQGPAKSPAGAPSSAASGAPSSAPSGATAGAHRKAPQPKPGEVKGADRIELERTEITGNRELPKVLYIVPWKKSELGDLVGKPVNSLLDEVLEPLDRDVFRRENRYFEGLKGEGGAPKTGAVSGSDPSH